MNEESFVVSLLFTLWSSPFLLGIWKAINRWGFDRINKEGLMSMLGLWLIGVVFIGILPRLLEERKD